MNKTLISLGTSLLVFSNSSLAQTDTRTDALVATIEANIASTLIDPCTGEQGTGYLNCRLKQPGDDRYTNDKRFQAQIASMRNQWNLWLSQSSYLPFEMRQDRVGGLNMSAGNTIIPSTHITPTFLPKDWGLKWGLAGNIKIEYRVPFDIGNLLSTKSPDIAVPPILLNKERQIAGNE